MRMWKVDPKLLCDRHLLGEHVEMHMFAGCLRKGLSLAGYVGKGLVEFHGLRARHAALAREMRHRSMRHRSPLARVRVRCAGRVDAAANLEELARRCGRCRARILRGGAAPYSLATAR